MIGNLNKAFETMSQEMEKVPVWFILTTVLLMLLLLVLYFCVIPRIKVKTLRRNEYRKYCIYGMLSLYVIVILAITILTREVQTHREYSIQLNLLDGFWKVDHIGRAAVRDVANLILFVPLGFLTACAFKGKKIWIKAMCAALVLSVCVEVCQLVGNLGAFDVDDILFNTLGGLSGAWCLGILRKVTAKD